MIPATFDIFRHKITEHAAVLRRHGLIDPAERMKGYKAPKRSQMPREIAAATKDDL